VQGSHLHGAYSIQQHGHSHAAAMIGHRPPATHGNRPTLKHKCCQTAVQGRHQGSRKLAKCDNHDRSDKKTWVTICGDLHSVVLFPLLFAFFPFRYNVCIALKIYAQHTVCAKHLVCAVRFWNVWNLRITCTYRTTLLTQCDVRSQIVQTEQAGQAATHF
jgi:hypothetical protein